MNQQEEIIRISIDLETMSLENNAAIVQIGACTIQAPSEASQCFNMYINPESAERLGLHVDKGTMEWWSKQDEAVRQRVFGGTEPLTYALASFEAWVACLCADKLENIRFYSKGAEDIIWLKNAYYTTIGRWPFHYRSPQNLRTLVDAMEYAGIVVPQFPNDTPHDALADALAQGEQVYWMLEQIRWSQSPHPGVNDGT